MMNLFLALVVHTSNVLGIFSDPFEFDGDYGTEVNPIREKVFELVVAKESLARHLTSSQVMALMPHAGEGEEIRSHLVAQAIMEDQQHGPLLSELVTPELVEQIVKCQQNSRHLGFTENHLDQILDFIERFGEQKIFRFFRHVPPPLLFLDKALRDLAAREGRDFDLPILSSAQVLTGQNCSQLKTELLDALFVEKTFDLTRPDEELNDALNEIDEEELKQLLGEKANLYDLEIFCTPAGQLFFYWLYHALDLHLVSEEPGLIEQINLAKTIFASTIGDQRERALALKKKLLEAGSSLLFTQESDAFLPHALLNEEHFLPVDNQNPYDGCFIFLKREVWRPDYTVIPLMEYPGFKRGKVNIILAALRNSGEKFLLASCHGHSTKPEDGRLQIKLIMDQFDALRSKPENFGLQLIIGIDANTKTPRDVQLFREHLDSLGLVATNCGPTTVKRRLVTTQHAKAGEFAIHEEDYLITLKPESGGHYRLANQTVGFRQERPGMMHPIPNLDNPSDHYPIGADLVPLKGTNF